MSSSPAANSSSHAEDSKESTESLHHDAEMELGTFSMLPRHLMERIARFLTTKDAARLSILSSKWREIWLTIPRLLFDEKCFPPSSKRKKMSREKLVSIIDQVLLLHTGSLVWFKLSLKEVDTATDVDRWIHHVCRKSLKALVLEMWPVPQYKIPFSLYRYQDLTYLELFNCTMMPPPSFGGFKTLNSLTLEEVTIAQDALDNLISCCPLLECLSLIYISGIQFLKIRAPNLLWLCIESAFGRVILEGTLKLSTVDIELQMNADIDVNAATEDSGNLLMFFDRLPSIETLNASGVFFKYLALGNVPQNLPTALLQLHCLSVSINFNDPKENLAALCLLQSAPNLQNLQITVRKENNAAQMASSLWAGCDANLQFEKLQSGKITGITNARPELEFTMLLLANSPALEKLTVQPAKEDARTDLVKQLLRFKRASAEAEVILLDP
ncbi:hypothetical protein Droror1_Dr00005664 [Drosera rotundifolia]